MFEPLSPFSGAIASSFLISIHQKDPPKHSRCVGLQSFDTSESFPAAKPLLKTKAEGMRCGALLLRFGLRSGLLDRAGLSRSHRIVPEQRVEAHDARLQESVQKSKEAAKSLRPTTDSCFAFGL